jgi:hypothetical protein
MSTIPATMKVRNQTILYNEKEKDTWDALQLYRLSHDYVFSIYRPEVL